MQSEPASMSAPVHAVVTQLGLDSPDSVAPYYESGEWKRDGVSPEMLAADCVTMFSAIERVSRMMTHSHFSSLHKYSDRWGIAHKSWDGVSTGEISDSDFMRLLDVWEQIAESLEVHESASGANRNGRQDHDELAVFACSLRNLVMSHFGGVGAISPVAYQYELGKLAHACGRTVDGDFRREVTAILRDLPCPLD